MNVNSVYIHLLVLPFRETRAVSWYKKKKSSEGLAPLRSKTYARGLT